jgi:hypothetical protein
LESAQSEFIVLVKSKEFRPDFSHECPGAASGWENVFGSSGAEWDEKAPHVPDSPDLAPSDFYLSGHVK